MHSLFPIDKTFRVESWAKYEYESNLFTIYSTRVTIEADITLVFLFHN